MTKIVDHSAEVLAQLARNKRVALTAMGLKAVELIVTQMQGGYGRPIWQTGDLQGDVNSEVGRSSPDTVDVGNSLYYAPFVHEGTCRMRARPYITDAIMGGKGELEAVASDYLKQGF